MSFQSKQRRGKTTLFFALSVYETMNLEQMRNINGSAKSVACKADLAGLGIGLISLAAGASVLGTGPIGWAAGLSLGASLFGAGFSGGMSIVHCL